MPRTAMSLKFPTFSRRFRTLLSLGGPICILYGLVGSLGHARLWTWHTISLHPLVKIMLDHGSQTSPLAFLKPIYFFFENFWMHKFYIRILIQMILIVNFSSSWYKKNDVASLPQIRKGKLDVSPILTRKMKDT